MRWVVVALALSLLVGIGYAADFDPPQSIDKLKDYTVNCSCINWTWTNPTDADFEGVSIYKNNNFVHNATGGISSYWCGLEEDTSYTISTHTYDTSGNLNATWVNATTTTTTCPGVPDESWEACFPWCGIQEIFFWNATSDISGYLVLDHIPELAAEREVNVTVSSATGSKQLGAWVSPAGSPGVTTIAPGVWRFRTYHNVSSQVGITKLEFHILNRSSDGTETDLFYGNAITRDINTLDPTEQLLSYARRNVTTMFSGDRLVIKVNASSTSVTARTVYMWLGGNTNTSMVQASNFICCDSEDGSCSGGGGDGAVGAAFGIIGGIIGGIVILRRRKR